MGDRRIGCRILRLTLVGSEPGGPGGVASGPVRRVIGLQRAPLDHLAS